MSGFTTNLINAILDDNFGSSGGPSANNHYLGLSETEPDSSESGFTELSGGNYGRIYIPNLLSQWNTSVNGVKTNAVDHLFPVASADWNPVGWWALFSSSSGSSFDAFGPIVDSNGEQTIITVLNGDQFRFLAGDLEIKLEGVL